MRVLRLSSRLAVLWLAAFPVPAFAADLASESDSVVPGWLSMGAGAVGLLIAATLLLDAYQLRRVAEGSMVAVNIAYMTSAVGCFAVSTILRWVEIFAGDRFLAEQSSFAADLLIIAGMALLAVYFYRVRKAMTSYLKALSGPAEQIPRETTAEGRDG